MTAAALGTQLTLPLLEADLPARPTRTPRPRPTYDLEIRPGTQSGSEQVIRGFGVPSLRGGRGDLVVSIVGRHPDPARPAPGGAAARARRDPRRGAARRPGRGAAQVDVRPAPRRLPGLSTDVAPGPPRRRRWTGSPSGSVVEVTGDEAHHAVAVRRLREGEHVVLTDGRGHLGHRGGRRRPASGSSPSRWRRVAHVERPEPVVHRRPGAAQGRARRARRRGAHRGRRRPRSCRGRRRARSRSGRASAPRSRTRSGRPPPARPPSSRAARGCPTVTPLASTADLAALVAEADLAAGAPRGRHRAARRARRPRPPGGSCVVVGPEGGIAPDELARLRGRRRARPYAWAPRCCAPPPPASSRSRALLARTDRWA